MTSPSQPEMVLRDQLPMPGPYIAPRTETERQLAEIWRTTLMMDRVGIDDSYHDLGGDSFLATIIFSMIEEKLGVTIPMAIFNEVSTIAELAARIEALPRP